MRLVGLGSILACMIVIASFVLFAINETSSASSHQQQVLGAGSATSPAGGRPEGTSAPSRPSAARRAVDEASEWLTSPFAGLTSDSHSEWAIRAVGLLLALAVYGFGVGFIARLLRVRV
jgi:hypothetical protein